jgi:hypothetical protein
MGLAEHLQSDAVLDRRTVPFSGSGMGSVYFGAAYIILAIEVDRPCRIRLYDNLSSRNNSTEASRQYGVGLLSDNIALTADINITAPGRYTLDPVLYGVPRDTSNYLTYFNITGNTGTVQGNLFLYKLEDETIEPYIEGECNSSLADPACLRTQLEFVKNNNSISGPRTFLMLDVIANTNCRLRLYATPESRDSISENNRQFDQAITDPNILLIADIVLQANQRIQFSPKIISANLGTLPQNLEIIRTNRVSLNSFSTIYYTLDTISTTASIIMNVFSLED